MRVFKMLIPLLGAVLWFAATPLWAQEDEAPAQKQYREDYEQWQKITAVKEPLKRAEEWLQFIQDRPTSRLLPNVQTDFLMIVQDLGKQARWNTMLPLTERFIKLRPRVGETYYYYGQALNELKKYDEAIDALARCYILKNPGSDKAKLFLDAIYKNTHHGSIDGLDALIKRVRASISG